MKLISAVILVYGVILFLGGVAAYIGTAGIITLAIAALSGIILVVCSGMIKKGNFNGVYISLLFSFGNGMFFGLKYSKYNSIMPDGILTIISMFAIGYCVYALSNKEQYSKK